MAITICLFFLGLAIFLGSIMEEDIDFAIVGAGIILLAVLCHFFTPSTILIPFGITLITWNVIFYSYSFFKKKKSKKIQYSDKFLLFLNTLKTEPIKSEKIRNVLHYTITSKNIELVKQPNSQKYIVDPPIIDLSPEDNLEIHKLLVYYNIFNLHKQITKSTVISATSVDDCLLAISVYLSATPVKIVDTYANYLIYSFFSELPQGFEILLTKDLKFPSYSSFTEEEQMVLYPVLQHNIFINKLI